MNNQPIIMERVLHAPVHKVWQALTDKDQMKQWYFDVSSFKPEVGHEFTFSGTSDDRTYVHHCKITDVIPDKKLQYTWRYEGYEGNSTLTFELFPEGDNTRLKLTHEGLETFPQATKDFARSSFEAGWTHIIGSSLPNFLAQ